MSGPMLSENENQTAGDSQPSEDAKARTDPPGEAATVDANDARDDGGVSSSNMSSSNASPSPQLLGQQAKSPSPQIHAQQATMPVMTNRPPSAASTHSNTSGGGPRTTTTSRRGGRTRSRSPVSSIAFSTPAGNNDSIAPMAPSNLSSAAKAAAASAMALANSRGAGRERPWTEGGLRGEDSSRYHQGARSGGYENMFTGSRNWPAEDAGHGKSPMQPTHFIGSDRPHRFGLGGRDSGDGYYKGPTGMAPINDGPDHGGAKDAQSGDGGPITFRTQEKPTTPPNSEAPKDGGNAATVKRAGGTSRVIGTATPIHVPRASEGVSSRPSGTASSVFRDPPSGPADNGDDDSPQKILLSLRTPTTSFEERETKGPTAKGSNKKGDASLSPEEPPQIQHSHLRHQKDNPLGFEPQRSPNNPNGTLEMAPSFSLFNQSFDSLGESAPYLSVGGPLDATFNTSHSFGNGVSGSNDNNDAGGTQYPPGGSHHSRMGSFGPANQQYLGGSSSGEKLTFGMSPVNSFGNGPSGQGNRNGSMMVLGGQDARAPSPMQMLNMYQTYSGGGYGGHPPPFRPMSGPPMVDMGTPNGGSFGGGATGPFVYTPRSFGAEGPQRSPYYPSLAQEGVIHSQEIHRGRPNPNFYAFLRTHRGAFVKCSFLLPGLKAALLESPLSDSKKSNDSLGTGKDTGRKGRSSKKGQKANPIPDGRHYQGPSPRDTSVAMRRVISAVCMFGGTMNADPTVQAQAPASGNGSQSIFRGRSSDDNFATATVTPSSTMGTPPGSRFQSASKAKYEELLPQRYYENENRLSWEFEESPPVDGGDQDDPNKNSNNNDDGSESFKRMKTSHEGGAGEDGAPPPSSYPKQNGPQDENKSGPDQPKMRYRCKLCGLPKQNHRCTYKQSLQRSIGVMIYPAVNAFTSSEPGLLAPALEEMNNFVSGTESISSGETGTPSRKAVSPSRPTPERKRHLAGQTQAKPGTPKGATVTPETLRSTGPQVNSPGGSSLSTGSGTPQGTPFRSPASSRRKNQVNMSGGAAMSRHKQLLVGSDDDLLFVSAMELKPEQFRIVTTSKLESQPDAYTYASLPLPYAQRKRLSDNLFALSKEVPKLTDECALVLREAREKDMWDLAVAELMTQVVVVIHCREGDNQFEGLRQYLLSMGVAC